MYISATLPYSAEALAAFIANYHASIWPVQIAAALLALAALYGLFRVFAHASRVIGLILTLFWGWTGYLFYIREFSSLSFLAALYGGFFLLQAVMLFGFTVIADRLDFQVTRNRKEWAGFSLILLALLIYPTAIAWYEGQWSSVRLVGVTPLATTFYTLGFVTLAKTGLRIKIILSLIPLLHVLASCITAWLLL